MYRQITTATISHVYMRLGLITLLFLGLIFQGQAQEVKMKSAFNGKNLKGWVIPEDNIWWTVNDGSLHAKSDPEKTGSILWTQKEYSDGV